MSFATGYLQGLQLKELQAQQVLAERHAQAEQGYRDAEFSFRKSQWSDEQRQQHSALLANVYQGWNSLQASFSPQASKDAAGNTTFTVVPADQQRARTRSFRNFAISQGLAPSEVTSIMGANLPSAAPTGLSDLAPPGMPGSPQEAERATLPTTPAPAAGPSTPPAPPNFWTRPTPAPSTPADTTAPAVPATPATPAERPAGVPPNAVEVGEGIYQVPHADPLKRQSVLGLIASFPPKLRQAASAIAVASGDQAEKALSEQLGKDLTQEEMEQRMLDVLRERQADKGTGGDVDPRSRRTGRPA